MPSSGYALFDLDQTLVPWDSQLLFCNWIQRRHPARRFFLLVLIPFLPLAGILGAGGMKLVFLAYLLGMTSKKLERETREFTDCLLRNAMYPELLKRLAEEKSAGRTTILTSASPEIYVRKIGRRLGFDHAFGTRFELFGQGNRVPLFPDLAGSNNKGHEKVRRMVEEGAIPPNKVLENSRAYTDSQADSPMLALCQEAVLVNPSDSLAAAGKDKGWEIIRPPRPANSKTAFVLQSLRQLLGLFPFPTAEPEHGKRTPA